MGDRARQSGFSLIEIVAACAVVMVLASLAVPRLGEVVERMRAEEGKQLLTQMYGAQIRYWQEHDHKFPRALADADIELRGSNHFYQLTLFSDSPCLCRSEITRKDNSYTLRIDRKGRIQCFGKRCKALGLK